MQFITTNMNVKVLEGNKVVEVKNAGINKGKAASRWLNESFNFILAAGDDWTDEDTFNAMPDSAYTLKIGNTPTSARYNLHECGPDYCTEMRNLLITRAQEGHQVRRKVLSNKAES